MISVALCPSAHVKRTSSRIRRWRAARAASAPHSRRPTAGSTKLAEEAPTFVGASSLGYGSSSRRCADSVAASAARPGPLAPPALWP